MLRLCYLRKSTIDNNRGFTLIELILIIVIIAILSTFVFFPDDDDQSHVSLRAKAEQIASAIRYAQNLGFTKGARYRINFLTHCTGGSSPSCYWFSNMSDTIKLDNPRTNTDTITLPSDITLSSTNSALIFNGKGIPYTTAAGTALSSNAEITLTASNGESQKVIVSPETGRVIVQ